MGASTPKKKQKTRGYPPKNLGKNAISNDAALVNKDLGKSMSCVR